MSKYTIYYSDRKRMYRNMATAWSAWADSASLSSVETIGMAKFFSSIARRFGLINEFREIGVI